MTIDGIGSYKFGVDLNKVDLISDEKAKVNKDSDANTIGAFGGYLSDALNELNNLQQTSEKDKLLVASGQADNLPQVMINSQKAEVSLQYAVQLRNKVVEAYNEIMRMTF